VIEIGPEAPFLNGGFEIPVGRYDQPDVHGDFLDAADAKEARAIQHAEQFHLEPCVQLAILVEKQSSAIRHFEQTRLGGVGAAEGALFVAEQLALQQILRQRGAVYVHPRLRRARGEMMDRSRDDFFSRPAFAGDQHRGLVAATFWPSPEDGAWLRFRKWPWRPKIRSVRRVRSSPIVSGSARASHSGFTWESSR